MKAYRIHITSWTASFRYPNLISGFQPSLPVPPLSTIYGLISAAAGNYVCASDVAAGYVFRHEGQTIDLETIYQFSVKSPLKTKSNVIRRQILFDTALWLYLEDAEIAERFLTPEFQLLLGRSGDLASVVSVDETELEPEATLDRLRGTVVPMKTVPLGAPIQALPVSFTNEIPRRNMGTRPFFMLEHDFDQPEPIPESGFYDPALGFQIYWHDYRDEMSVM
ncbi:type I-B CRISPR-associated protein Cas5 [Desulfonema ishimotonii]|uniref:Type I-B CRISPR-associated protein Cas5 n=1 Tax=Desulfonema ishimotonii TaxID=45657 RepID=A0A401FUL6_9BACT|nr:type I-B CRISPR-associated protein Cas5b [Desulfonema ishimotonii]GBC60650.1 type I-B CRISPR-associated protein Cas5 [Desulfonema ishimotonii]